MKIINFKHANGEVVFVLAPKSKLEETNYNGKASYKFYPDSTDYQTYYNLTIEIFENIKKQMLK